MEKFTDVLSDATSKISDDYFHLRIDGGDTIYRERVYCYELYHQMRSCWPLETDYYLNGEIDKAAHPILKKCGADHLKPDFLIHKPGYMEGNYGIIEVKTEVAPHAGIKKDLETLSLFVNRVGYQHAIYLLYGRDLNESIMDRINQEAKEVNELAFIDVWIHPNVGEPAFQIGQTVAR